MNVLLVEDDSSVGEFVAAQLQAAGHHCVHKLDGEEGLNAARDQAYDVLVLDRMLPRLDGLSLVKKLRELGNKTPVLILSALGEVDDRVKGLHSGADDYLVKPFSMDELLARLEVLQRRASMTPADVTSAEPAGSFRAITVATA